MKSTQNAITKQTIRDRMRANGINPASSSGKLIFTMMMMLKTYERRRHQRSTKARRC